MKSKADRWKDIVRAEIFRATKVPLSEWPPQIERDMAYRFAGNEHQPVEIAQQLAHRHLREKWHEVKRLEYLKQYEGKQ